MADDERAQRLAELKKKMQASAKAKKAAPATAETAKEPAVEKVESPPQTEVAATAAPASETSTPAVAENEKPKPVVAAPSPVTASVFKEPAEVTPEDRAKSQMNRREFLTYAWGAALGLAVLQTGLVSFFFMYPRFKAGEFGGAFFMGPETALPPTDAPPRGEPDGKFWWVNVPEDYAYTDPGPHAIYMVCTHLGCLYKWVDENNRFECPCHGSKYTREGFYIEGPAPRSLDQFEVDLVDDVYVVDTGAKTLGPPSDESPFKGTG